MTTELFKHLADENQITDEPTIFANGQWLGLVSHDLEAGICKAVKLEFGVWPNTLSNVFDVNVSDVEMMLRF